MGVKFELSQDEYRVSFCAPWSCICHSRGWVPPWIWWIRRIWWIWLWLWQKVAEADAEPGYLGGYGGYGGYGYGGYGYGRGYYGKREAEAEAEPGYLRGGY